MNATINDNNKYIFYFTSFSQFLTNIQYFFPIKKFIKLNKVKQEQYLCEPCKGS